jgi:flagellar hook assembly protein FlgD
LYAPSPNPVSTTTRLTFALSTSTAVRLELYDLTGRLVRRIVDGVVFPAGPHALTWDGRTDAGTAARSGLYLARLSAGGAESTTRIVLER